MFWAVDDEPTVRPRALLPRESESCQCAKVIDAGRSYQREMSYGKNSPRPRGSQREKRDPKSGMRSLCGSGLASPKKKEREMTVLLLTDQEITTVFEGTAAPLVSVIGLHNLLPEARAIAQAQAEATWTAREPEIDEARKAGIREVAEWLYRWKGRINSTVGTITFVIPMPDLNRIERGEMPGGKE